LKEHKHIIKRTHSQSQLCEAQARAVNSHWHDRAINESAIEYIKRKHAELTEEDIFALLKDGFTREEIEEDMLCPCPKKVS